MRNGITTPYRISGLAILLLGWQTLTYAELPANALRGVKSTAFNMFRAPRTNVPTNISREQVLAKFGMSPKSMSSLRGAVPFKAIAKPAAAALPYQPLIKAPATTVNQPAMGPTPAQIAQGVEAQRFAQMQSLFSEFNEVLDQQELANRAAVQRAQEEQRRQSKSSSNESVPGAFAAR